MSKINEKRRVDAAIADMEADIAEQQRLLEAKIAEQQELLAVLYHQSAALGRSWHCDCGATAFIPSGHNPPANWWIWDDSEDETCRACPKCARRDKRTESDGEWRLAGWTRETKRADKKRRRKFIGDDRSRRHWEQPRLYLDHDEQNLYRGTKLQVLGYMCQTGGLFPQLEEWMPEDEWDCYIPDDVRVVHLDNNRGYSIIDIRPGYAATGERELSQRGIELE